jgi:hypothetical protein
MDCITREQRQATYREVSKQEEVADTMQGAYKQMQSVGLRM